MKDDHKGNIMRLKLRIIILLALSASLWESTTLANKSSNVSIHHFPQPPLIRNQVKFWEAIFEKYSQHQTVIHDSYFPHIIVDIIDYKVFQNKINQGRKFSKRQKTNLVSKYIKRYAKAIKRIQSQGRLALKFGSMEKRVFKVYKRDRAAYLALRNGKARLRSQTGLKDEFSRAATRAKSYLPYMERTFRKHGLPKDLTRMVFVESMFNLQALSKVGASGIWQFMPRTGRLFLRVTRWLDERNSPLKATEAAAKLLSANYKELGTWPLAITAYNHGVGGMKRATQNLATTDFSKIVAQYKSRTFGFASRNFYAEFLAAKAIFNRKFQHLVIGRSTPESLSKITLNTRHSIKSLTSKTPLTEAKIREHNPEINHKTLRRYRHNVLPRNYQLIIPTKYTKHLHKVIRPAHTRRL